MKTKPLGTAQSAVEFALVLPLLMVVIFGILEMGRLTFLYVSVLNASREAARYGSASGSLDASIGNHQYENCQSIKDAAKRLGFLANIEDNDISIKYDQGPTTNLTGECDPDVPVPATGYIHLGSRIVITVQVRYSPLVPLIPFTFPNITSTSARTILEIVNISGTAAPPPTLIDYTEPPTESPTPTSTPTVTPSPTVTASVTQTETITLSPTITQTETITLSPTITQSPTETQTLTITPSVTQTSTSTSTPTSTTTETSTSTPTATATLNCSNITLGIISQSNTPRTIAVTNNSSSPVQLTSFDIGWSSGDWLEKTVLQFVGSAQPDFTENINGFDKVSPHISIPTNPISFPPDGSTATLSFYFKNALPSTDTITVHIGGCSIEKTGP